MMCVSRLDGIVGQRKGERGAALVIVLLLSTLLLAAGGTLILTTSMSALTAIDSTSEMQAYYGAEAGLQAALNVLRGNVVSTNPAGTQASFLNVKANPSLSTWLQYNTNVNGTPVVSINNVGSPFSAYRVNVLDLDVTPVGEEPARLLVQVTGYGPRGSIKQMEMVVSKGPYTLDPPAAITLIGAEAGPSMLPGDFDIGDSSPKGYSGTDAAPGTGKVKATFGFTRDLDRNLADCTFSALCSLYAISPNPLFSSKSLGSTDDTPRTKLVANAELPSWLRTASATRFFLGDVKATAEEMNRSFTATPTNAQGFGTAAKPALTYVEGDCDFSGNGAGLLIVTGTLTLKGDFNYEGVILVLGQGQIIRNGGGGGGINGALVMANFAPVGNGGFTARPVFNTNGGGNSDIKYHSQNIARAFETLGPSVRGAREK